MHTLVRAAVLTNYLEVARGLGLNPLPLLRRHGISPSLIGDHEHRIRSIAAVALLEDSARETGELAFGLRMAETRRLSDFGALSLLLTHQRTLRDALNTIIQYRRLLNDALALSVEAAGEMAIVHGNIVTDTPMPSRQATELVLGVVSRFCASLLGGRWSPYCVTFTHDAPPNLQAHRRVFGAVTKLEFNSDFNGVVFAAAELDRPLPAADPAMAKYAERFIETLPAANQQSIVRDVRRAIYMLLPDGRATIDHVAEDLGLNVRTLQRRLEDTGSTFTELVDEARRHLALKYMENHAYSLGRIAELLGYSMPSSFTRWFTAQFGVAPARWRAGSRAVETADA
jgi:AraC-like DNA-binding protein